MSGKKRNGLRDAVSQIMYCCSGEKEQYEETVNTVLAAVEVYVTQLTRTALKNVPPTSKGKVTVDSIAEALSCDIVKKNFVESLNENKSSNGADK